MKIKQISPNCLGLSLSSSQEKRRKIDVAICRGEEDIKTLKAKSDVLILTKNAPLEMPKGKQTAFVIDSPGEYEIQGVFIQGLGMTKEKEMALTTIMEENLIACYLEGSGWRELSSEQMEAAGTIDVLIIPLEGEKGLSAKEIREAISEIEPKMVVFVLRLMKKKSPEGIAEILREMGIKSFESLNELSVRKEELKEEGRIVIVLLPE